ncbi:ATP-dependent DNA helicase RecQ [Lentibacillus saliphilus]|uniref:RecQ family ATP-dependent DNA helicase n=1 Tax=Lentibacillus saliphilus TaxID=2737028 RepID=UPI0031B9C506
MCFNLEQELYTHFQYETFRLGQKTIIEDVLNGEDVLGILPTGSGKSVCYQLPAKLLPGLTIVVSPLISLMTDQVKQLKARHYTGVVALNSFLSMKDRQAVLRNLSAYKLIYISPELLQQSHVLSMIQQQTISLFVVDEAHCISQWGHEFRPDYLKLSAIIAQLGHPPILALSATATPRVQEDIMAALKRPHMMRHIFPMDRENIAFIVEETENPQDKLEIMTSLLAKHHVPTIIYFSSRQLAEQLAITLSQKLPDRRIAYYHGGMEQTDRLLIQQQYMTDQVDVICCTSAFGMGIDKSNIRLVIHYHFPTELESYIQEVGRAGRDGEHSVALLLFSEADIMISENLITRELPDEANLEGIFQRIKQILQTNDRESSDEEIAALINLNEIQWRYLKHQLIKHDIMNGKQVVCDDMKWERAREDIRAHIVERMFIKRRQLRKMIAWIRESDCLRRQLYKHFQDGYTEKHAECCSNCGYTIRDVQLKAQILEQQNNNWQDHLKKLLLQDNVYAKTE